MADDSVFISGFAQDSLKEALSDIPAWATEKTASDMAMWLKKSYGKQTELLAQAIKCCGKGSGVGDTKKVSDEMRKLNRLLKMQNEESAKGLKLAKAKRDSGSLLGGKKLENTGEKINYVMAGLAVAGAKVTGVMSDYVDVYDSLYKSGINVLNGNNSTRDGFEALNQTVLLTGLKLQDLQAVAEKYSTSVNAVGFQKFAKATAMSTTRLEALGFSSKEGAELIASLIEAESGFSDIRGKSARDISNDAIKMGSQFDKLSKTMGISRQQILDNLKTTAKSSDSTLVAAKWGEEAALNVSKAVAGIKDVNLRDTLTKMAAAADPIFTQAYKDLQASGQGVLADQLANISKSLRSIDPTEVPKILEQLGANISRSGISSLADQMAGGNASAQASLELITAIKQQSVAISQATVVQNDASLNTERSIAAFQTQTTALSASLQAAFSLTISQLDIATDVLRKFNEATYGLIGAIDSETRSWIGVGIIVAGFIAGLVLARGAITTFTSLFTRLAPVAETATSTLGPALGRLGGLFLRFAGPVAALYAALQFGVSIGETLTEMFTGIANAGGYLDAAIDLLSPIGDTISGWYSSFSKSVSDAFTDAVKGIKDFGKSIAESFPVLTSIFDTLSKFVSGVLNKFANKMSFGLIGSATSDFVEKSSVPKSTTISVPTAPVASTISSPSAMSAKQDQAAAAVSKSVDGSRESSPVIPKPGANADINNLLSYQASVLERLLLSSNDLLSVNKDILRYARVNS